MKYKFMRRKKEKKKEGMEESEKRKEKELIEEGLEVKRIVYGEGKVMVMRDVEKIIKERMK